MTLINNASGGDSSLWDRARTAWARYATARDSVPRGSEDGIFTPKNLADEIDKREPMAYGTGGARSQSLVNAAQRALLAPTRAARQAAAGRPLTQPEDLAARAAGAITPQATQPSYQNVTPGL